MGFRIWDVFLRLIHGIPRKERKDGNIKSVWVFGRPPLRPLTVSPTIIVVDDDAAVVELIQRILQKENYRILVAGSADEALKKVDAASQHVDLLITDFLMPEMQGPELAAKLRERYAGIKVLYQTGYSDLLFENRLELGDGEAFIDKPFTGRALRETVRLLLFGTLNPGSAVRQFRKRP